MDWSSFFIGVGVGLGIVAVPSIVFMAGYVRDWERGWGYR